MQNPAILQRRKPALSQGASLIAVKQENGRLSFCRTEACQPEIDSLSAVGRTFLHFTNRQTTDWVCDMSLS
jgi:hypothetical protein